MTVVSDVVFTHHVRFTRACFESFTQRKIEHISNLKTCLTFQRPFVCTEFMQ